jgi:hypothetical protein
MRTLPLAALAALAAFAALAALAACTSKSVVIPELTSTPISANEGGIALSADGDFIVTVPPHVLAADAHLDIFTDRMSPTRSSWLTPTYYLRPSDLRLLAPIDIAFNVHAGVSRPAIMEFDPSSPAPIATITTVYDANRARAEGKISHVDGFSLAGVYTSTSAPPPVMTAYTSTAPVDFLFVVDNSSSMDSKQNRLILAASVFIGAIAGRRDYQIGVVSTDRTNGVERAGISSESFASSPPFQLQMLDVSMCTSAMIDKGCLLGPDPSNRLLKNGSMTPEAEIAAFRRNLDVGSCGSGIETGIMGALSSLSLGALGMCNQGLVRANAELVIVIISDENDTDATPIAQYVDQIGGLKDYAKLRVAVITAEENGIASNCSIPNGAACGSLCENPPPAGSLTACVNNPSCPLPGETCTAGTGTTTRCDNGAHALFSPDTCASCTFFATPDCCEAIAINNPHLGEPGRYLEFARALEQRIGPAAHIPVTGCQPTDGPTACLIETICQEDYAATMQRIARL